MLANLTLEYIEHLERGYCANHPDVLAGTKDQVVDRAVKQLLTALQSNGFELDGNLLKRGNGWLRYNGTAWQYSNDAGVTWQSIGSAEGLIIDHTQLSNIGTNTHAQLDTHVARTDIHRLAAGISHTELGEIGNYTHAQIDGHINTTGLHVSDHTLLSNIGTKTHAQLDDHLANTALHSGGGGGGSTPLVSRYESAPTLTTSQYTGNIIICDFDGTLDLPTPTTDGQSLRIIHPGSGDLTVAHHISVQGVVKSEDDNLGGYLYIYGKGSIYLVYHAASEAWISVTSQGNCAGSEAA